MREPAVRHPSIRSAGFAAALLVLAMTAAGRDAIAQPDPGRAAAGHGCTALAPAPVVPIADEPSPRLIAEAPIPSQLAEGRVVIRYCAQNVRILPVFGQAALGVSPRIGHLHVTVNDGPYRWLDTSGQPVIVNKLPPGPHRILLELVDPTHRTLDRQVVSFIIPDRPGSH